MTRMKSAPLLLLTTLIALVCNACGGSSGGGTSPIPPPAPLPPPPAGLSELDLLVINPGDGLTRLHGAAGPGDFGVPVAGGFDCDGDGLIDYGMASMRASPLGRQFAGEVYLVFGDGTIGQTIDTAVPNPQFLTIAGGGPSEAAGNEIWMDDVTGDGIGDLIIGRQNFRASGPDRIGAGALSIVVGGPQLRIEAVGGLILDISNPPAGIDVLTLHGAAELDRLGIWMRTGDVTGDGIADLLVGADQEDDALELNRGAAYVIRGGAHLASGMNIDLANFGATALFGHIAKITPPQGANGYHLGATVNIADLDNNGRSEVLLAATLNRSGASIQAEDAPAGSAESTGGSPRGTLYIAWDDNFGTDITWPVGFTFATDSSAPGSITSISGAQIINLFSNRSFGEEILGGLDYDGDGESDLFVGDITASALVNRSAAGTGHIFFSASDLKGLTFALDTPPATLRVTTILGPEGGVISSDTSLHGDFDADGIADLGVAAPLASPDGRQVAGSVYVLWGQSGPWPEFVDLEASLQPDPLELRITEILGAFGTDGADNGDTLGYSAATGDLDADGRIDLILNEMRGNGASPGTIDVGNLIVISGALMSQFK